MSLRCGSFGARGHGTPNGRCRAIWMPGVAGLEASSASSIRSWALPNIQPPQPNQRRRGIAGRSWFLNSERLQLKSLRSPDVQLHCQHPAIQQSQAQSLHQPSPGERPIIEGSGGKARSSNRGWCSSRSTLQAAVASTHGLSRSGQQPLHPRLTPLSVTPPLWAPARYNADKKARGLRVPMPVAQPMARRPRRLRLSTLGAFAPRGLERKLICVPVYKLGRNAFPTESGRRNTAFIRRSRGWTIRSQNVFFQQDWLSGQGSSSTAHAPEGAPVRQTLAGLLVKDCKRDAAERHASKFHFMISSCSAVDAPSGRLTSPSKGGSVRAVRRWS